MHEPAAIWGLQNIIFDKDISKTQNIILSQGREALKAVIYRILELEKYSTSGSLVNVGIDDRIHSIISDLCYQAGLASTILLNESRRSSMESETAYQLRMERVHYVNKICREQNIEISIMKNRKIRNALTHIDERLADNLTKKENIGWFIDVAINPNEWKTNNNLIINYCRCYDKINKRILHLGYELDVCTLYKECLAVLAVVFGVNGKSIKIER